MAIHKVLIGLRIVELVGPIFWSVTSSSLVILTDSLDRHYRSGISRLWFVHPANRFGPRFQTRYQTNLLKSWISSHYLARRRKSRILRAIVRLFVNVAPSMRSGHDWSFHGGTELSFSHKATRKVWLPSKNWRGLYLVSASFCRARIFPIVDQRLFGKLVYQPWRQPFGRTRRRYRGRGTSPTVSETFRWKRQKHFRISLLLCADVGGCFGKQRYTPYIRQQKWLLFRRSISFWRLFTALNTTSRIKNTRKATMRHVRYALYAWGS